MTARGARLEEILDVMNALWSNPIVDIQTSHERVAPSAMGLKPAQPGGPRILLAGTTDAALVRVAERADGWLPFGIPLTEVAAGWKRIRDYAISIGRDPRPLQLVVRADPHCSDVRLGRERPVFTGTCRQIADDLDQVRSLGADEVILDLHETARSVDELFDIALTLPGRHVTAAA